jgi:hypothetical protein
MKRLLILSGLGLYVVTPALLGLYLVFRSHQRIPKSA